MFPSIFKSSKKNLTFSNFNVAKHNSDNIYSYRDYNFYIFKFESKFFDSFVPQFNLSQDLSIFFNFYDIDQSLIYTSLSKTLNNNIYEYYLFLNIPKKFIFKQFGFSYNEYISLYDLFNLLTTKYFYPVDNDLNFNYLHKNSEYFNLSSFDYSLLTESLGTYLNNVNTKNEGFKFFNRSLEPFYFDEFRSTDTYPNVIFSASSSVDRISFLQNIFNKDIEIGKELYLINYYNDFMFEKSNINKIALDNLSFNFFSLYKEDNEFLNNLIISSYEAIICYILNIKQPEKVEEITELNYISQAILQSFRKYREKNNLSYVVQFLKEYFDQERLSLLQPYIDKGSKLYNYFNGKFNVKLGESINIIKLDPKNKEHVLFEIAFLNSVLLFKRSQKNPSKFILSLEKIYDFNISKSYLSNIQRILRFSRKLNGSFYVPLDSGNYKYKGYLQDILCNINHLFLGQSKKNNENYFYLPKEYLDIQEKLIGSKEILYINNGIPYILSLEKEF